MNVFYAKIGDGEYVKHFGEEKVISIKLTGTLVQYHELFAARFFIM